MPLKASPKAKIDCGELGEHVLFYAVELLQFNNPSAVGRPETFSNWKWSDNEIIAYRLDVDYADNSVVLITKHLNRITGKLVMHQQLFKSDASVPATSSVQSATCKLKEVKF